MYVKNIYQALRNNAFQGVTSFLSVGFQFRHAPPFAPSVAAARFFNCDLRNIYIQDQNPILSSPMCLCILGDKMVYSICKNCLWERGCSVAVNDPCNSAQDYFFLFCLMVASWTDTVFKLRVENFYACLVCKIAIWFMTLISFAYYSHLEPMEVLLWYL